MSDEIQVNDEIQEVPINWLKRFLTLSVLVMDGETEKAKEYVREVVSQPSLFVKHTSSHQE